MCGGPFSLEDVVYHYVDEIEEISFVIKSHPGNLIEEYIRCGWLCIQLKALVENEDYVNFTTIVEEYLSRPIRTLQRYMRLARHLDHVEDKWSFALSATHLLALIRLKGDETIEEYLADNDIFLNFDKDDPDEVSFFKKEVQELIYENSVKSGISA